MRDRSGHSVRVEEITDDKLLELLSGHLAVSVGVDDLDVRGDVGGGR